MTDQFATPTDTDDISDDQTVARTHGNLDTDNISNTISLRRVTLLRSRANTVQISDTRVVGRAINTSDSVSISSSVATIGVYVQYDTWRPVPRPTDNNLIMVSRTPEGYHDSLVGLERLSIWTLHPDGTSEKPELTDPTINGYGWFRQSHPEWSPDGNWIVLAVETTGEYKLYLINSSAFGLF